MFHLECFRYLKIISKLFLDNPTTVFTSEKPFSSSIITIQQLCEKLVRRLCCILDFDDFEELEEDNVNIAEKNDENVIIKRKVVRFYYIVFAMNSFHLFKTSRGTRLRSGSSRV